MSRLWWGGPGRRPAAFLCEGVLVVSPHVEPHAATSIPQPVCAGRADVAQQEICHGESQRAKVRSQLGWALWSEVFCFYPIVLVQIGNLRQGANAFFKFLISKISVRVDLATPVVTAYLVSCYSKQLLHQKYNIRATGVSVYLAAKQNHMVLLMKSDLQIWFHAAHSVTSFPTQQQGTVEWVSLLRSWWFVVCRLQLFIQQLTGCSFCSITHLHKI